MPTVNWDAYTDPYDLIDALRPRASDRKLLLYGAAACRRVWDLMTDPRHRAVVEAAEQLAEAQLTEAALESVMEPVAALWASLPDATRGEWEPAHYIAGAARHLGTPGGAQFAAGFAARGLACLAGPPGSPGRLSAQQDEEATQCRLLRDLFGDTTRPFWFDPAWLAGPGREAVEQARGIDRDGRFDTLPSLGDVLERAGCRDRAVLDHCRNPGPHVRGCWVVDALLGRETAVRTGLVTAADWQACGDPEPLLHYLKDKGDVRQWRLFAVACCRRIDPLITDERSRRAVDVAARHVEGAASDDELEAARTAAQQALDEAGQAEYDAEAEAGFCTTPAYAAVACRMCGAAAARQAVCRDPRVTDAPFVTYEAEFWTPAWSWAASAVEDAVYASFGAVQGDDRWPAAWQAANAALAAEHRAQCDLLRDLFGTYLGPPGDAGGWLPMRADTLFQSEQWCRFPTTRSVTLPSGWAAWNGGLIPGLARAIYDRQAFDRLPRLAGALADAGCTDRELLAHLRGPGPHARGSWGVDLLLNRG